MAESSEDFNPEPYLTSLNGAAYLEVKYRLLWLRKKYPDAQINTELLRLEVLDNGHERALFKAVIETDTGAIATGHGSETTNDFRDHIEKAESKAIGRALAALGFGTQFAQDGGSELSAGRIVDSPVQRPQRPHVTPNQPQQGGPPRPVGPHDPTANELATKRQLAYLTAVAEGAGISSDEVATRAVTLFRHQQFELTQHEISVLTNMLIDERATVNAVEPVATR